MTRTLLVLGITLAAGLPARADITHKIQSSVQLQVDGAASQASRIGSTLSVSGSNVTLILLLSSGVSLLVLLWVIRQVPTASQQFQETPSPYSESYIEGDATPTATSVSSGVVTSLPMLGNTTTTAQVVWLEALLAPSLLMVQ